MIEAEHMVLSGHRSIVNQVRYNYEHGVIASSGVEKIIKVNNFVTLQQNLRKNTFLPAMESSILPRVDRRIER